MLADCYFFKFFDNLKFMLNIIYYVINVVNCFNKLDFQNAMIFL